MGKRDDLAAKMIGQLKAARAIAEAAEAANRDFNAEERAKIAGHLDEATKAKTELANLKADDDMLAGLRQMGEDIGLDLAGVGPAIPPPPGAGRDTKAGRSPGEAFTDSPEFKNFLGQFPNGRIPEKARVQSMPVAFKQLITTGPAGAGSFVRPEFYPDLLQLLGRVPLTVRNLVTRRTTGSDLVEYVRQTNRLNNAAVVPEATQTAGTSGIKPEGGFGFELVSAPVKTLAEWVPATKKAISDVAQLRGLIDDELRQNLAELEEVEILSGDGSGNHFTGLASTPGTQVQDFDTNLFTSTRKALTKIRTVGLTMPTAYLMSPEDDEAIDLAVDGQQRFFGAGPFGIGPATLWGLPRVVSQRIPAGTAWLGDWRLAVIWDREQASISLSDSHADFFIRNLVAVLAESRMAFGVLRPAAFCQIDLAASAGGTNGGTNGGTQAAAAAAATGK